MYHQGITSSSDSASSAVGVLLRPVDVASRPIDVASRPVGVALSSVDVASRSAESENAGSVLLESAFGDSVLVIGFVSGESAFRFAIFCWNWNAASCGRKSTMGSVIASMHGFRNRASRSASVLNWESGFKFDVRNIDYFGFLVAVLRTSWYPFFVIVRISKLESAISLRATHMVCLTAPSDASWSNNTSCLMSSFERKFWGAALKWRSSKLVAGAILFPVVVTRFLVLMKCIDFRGKKPPTAVSRGIERHSNGDRKGETVTGNGELRTHCVGNCESGIRLFWLFRLFLIFEFRPEYENHTPSVRYRFGVWHICSWIDVRVMNAGLYSFPVFVSPIWLTQPPIEGITVRESSFFVGVVERGIFNVWVRWPHFG